MKSTDINEFQDVSLTAPARPGVEHLFRGFLFVLLVLMLVGCRTANVNSPLALHPEKYRRVAILPICFGNSSPTGYTTAAGDSEEVRRQNGTELASALTKLLTHKGYQVVNPVRVLTSERDWSAIDLVASSILRQQFDLERIRANPGETNALYTYGFASSLPVLQEKLGLPEVDALMLVDRWERYVAPGRIGEPMSPLAHDTTVMILTGLEITCRFVPPDLAYRFDSGQLSGASASTPAQPEISACYSLYIFDAHTPQIIYSAYHLNNSKSPSRVVRALLQPLPKINEQ